MKALANFGLAAALLLGGSSLAIAQDAGADAAAGAGANVETGADAGGVDTTTTGSVNANYGSLISSMQSGSAPDLSTFTDTAMVECVGVSTLQGDANNNAQALDNAISQNEAGLGTLHTDIQANSAFMSKLQTSCADIAGFDVENVISVQSGTDGTWTVYVDDRAS